MAGGGGTNTVEKAELPEYVAPYAKELMNLSANLAYTPYQAYGGQMVADLAPQQQQALAMTQARALNGNPAMDAATSAARDTMNGQYLYRDTGLNPFVGDNPYLDQVISRTGNDMADAYARGTASSTMGQFAQGGAFGGSAHREMAEANNRAFADSVAGMAGNARMNNYNQSAGLYENYLNRNEGAFQNERGRQMQAMNFAPITAANDYTDLQALAGVGDITRGYAQDVLNTDYQQWQNAQNYGRQQMQTLADGIMGATGGGMARQMTGNLPGANPMAGAIGGAAAGYSIGGGPWGAAAGGLIGYLGSQ